MHLHGKLHAFVVMVLFAVLLLPITARGGNMDDVVKKAETELKKTDMDLKTGGHKKVFDKLPEIDKLVAEVQAKAPDHERLPGLVEKLKTQKEKVEAKLGKTLALTTDLTIKPKPAEPATAAEAPKAAVSPKTGGHDYHDGKIKRAGADEARAGREALREEEKKQAEPAAKSGASKDELYAYYSNTVYQPARLAESEPGNDIERHLEATEKIASEMPTIKKMLNSHKEFADDSSYQNLKKVEGNAGKWRTQAAKSLASLADGMMASLRQSKGADTAFGQQIGLVKKYLDFAAKYDAGLPEIKKLRDEIASLEKGAGAKVAGTKWEGHKNAPANAAELAAAGMKFFKGPKGWTDKYTVVATAIRGPWSVQKKNIVGAPILYGIPAHLAVQTEEDKKLKQARVFNGTLITVEKEGVKPEPPFEGFYVGDNWLVNADSVK